MGAERYTIYVCPKHGRRAGPSCEEPIDRQWQRFPDRCGMTCDAITVIAAEHADALAEAVERNLKASLDLLGGVDEDLDAALTHYREATR